MIDRLFAGVLLTLMVLLAVSASATDVSTEGDGDYKIGPTYTDAPELAVREGVPAGTLTEFTMTSEESKIYPGLKGPYKRKCWVYVPANHTAGTPLPFIVVQDGGGYTKNLTRALDNLIADKRVPSMAAVFVNSGGGDGKGSERGLEYDTVSDQYAMFIESEVLPRAVKESHVTFTKDPEGRATMGGSSGAAAAFTMAWFRPDLYRRVLSYSGTFVNQQSPANPKSQHGAWEYHEHLIPSSEAKPIRIWMEVGDKDNGFNRDEASLHNWVMANNRMAEALKTKGYHYRYEFAQGAGHVDGKVVRQTLPEALVWLWRGSSAVDGR
jgi:enterochelin esterase-like enzyme